MPTFAPVLRVLELSGDAVFVVCWEIETGMVGVVVEGTLVVALVVALVVTAIVYPAAE